MSNEVYANFMEISCKQGSGKAICAFPDVCFTPPQTPPTPTGVPIPYPNTGMDSDTTDGTSTVKVSGQEAMLKNKSCFKKSTGDEAGAAPKKGVVTSKNTGKVYFNVWSMDVKFEGENVVRNLDLTTHNHASFPGDTPTWPYLSKASVANPKGACAAEVKKIETACRASLIHAQEWVPTSRHEERRAKPRSISPPRRLQMTAWQRVGVHFRPTVQIPAASRRHLTI